MNQFLCIYHGGCADGFAAAWVVRKALFEKVDFHAGVYGDEPPDVTGRHVVMVDFSYPREVLQHMHATAASLTVIDHHLSAKEDLTDPDLLPTAEVIFKLGLSGCMLAWMHFFPVYSPPRLLKHIQDRDLWLFQLDATREIMAGLFSHPYDFAIYDHWMAASRLDGLATDGAAILRKQQQDLDLLLPLLTHKMQIGDHLVPVANLPHIMASDAGARLAAGQPFAATYWDGPKWRTFSLRSQAPDGEDVARIAEKYGGGGHRHAAGFRVDRSINALEPAPQAQA